MIRSLKKLLLTVFALVFLLSSASVAQLVPPSSGPEPSVDPANNVSDTATNGAYAGKSVATKVTEFINTLNSKIQGAASKVSAAVNKVKDKVDSAVSKASDKVSGFVNTTVNSVKSAIQKKKGEANIQVARKIEQPTVADFEDEDSVVAAFETMFLREPVDILKMDKYKSNQEAVRGAFRNKSKEFYYDSMLEMYLTVRSLEDRMNTLNEEFEALSACFVTGDESASDSSTLCSAASETDENLGIWKNFYQLNVIYDSMLRITEELTAIRAQYEVSKALASGIAPLTEQEQKIVDGKEDDESSESEASQQTSDAESVLNWTTSFSVAAAQLHITGSSEALNAETSAATVTANVSEAPQTSAKTSVSSKYQRTMTAPLTSVNSMSGSMSDYRDLAQMANISAQLNLAIDVHNLKFQMPSFRTSFLQVAKMRQLHDKSVERLKESEDCVVRYLNQYYDSPEDVWIGSDCVYSGQKLICQTGKTLASQDLSGLTSGDVLCPTDSSKLCSRFGINQYDSRGGFAGWLISAYKTAKAAKAVEVSEDDVSPSMTDDTIDTDLQNFDSVAKSVAADFEDTGDSLWTRPSKEKEFQTQTRDSELVGWQIGAEGAKAMGTDMALSEPKWGKVTNPYPLWNDEKFFYDQYLSEKYNNMKRFIRHLDMRSAALDGTQVVLDSLDPSGLIGGVAVSGVKSAAASILPTLSSLLAEDLKKEDSTTAAYLETLRAIEDLKAGFKKNMASYQAKEDGVYAKLDQQSEDFKAQKEEYNQIVSDKNQATAYSEMQTTTLGMLDDLKAKDPNYVSGFTQTAQENKASYDLQAQQAEQSQEDAAVKIDDARADIEDTNDQLTAVATQRADEKSNFIKNMSLAYAKRQAAENALDSSSSPSLGGDLLQTALKEADNSVAASVFSAAVSLSESYAEAVKSAVIDAIDEAYDEIMEMEDDLYDPSNHDEIVMIHRRLIEKIQQNIAVSPIETTLPIGDVASALSNLYGDVIAKAVCEDEVCKKTDDTYFVGLPAKAMDFEAPNAIVSSYTAPLREVVHFDTFDYQSVVKSDDNQTTREAFLDYGQDIPQVWKRILGTDGFVEKAVDLAEILSHNDGAQDHLLRGGTYPCRIGHNAVDFKNGQLYMYPASTEREVCKNIQSVASTAAGTVTFVFNNGERVSGLLGDEPDERQPSELSLLLTQSGTETGFNKKLTEIIGYFEELEKDEDATGETVKDRIYEDALLDRNQFGDFLDFVEMETLYQKAVEELEVKIDETRQKLIETFQEYGYDLPEDFDLADQATYDDLMNKLDERKNKLVDYALTLLSSVSSQQDPIKEKVAQAENQIKLLQTDSDEVLQISILDTAGSEFEERIKTAKVDQNAMDKYDEEAQAAHEKLLNNFKEPYCAVY